MSSGEWLTHGTIWFALSLYAAAELATTARPNTRGFATARWLNGVAVAIFLAHVGFAFHFYHHWSHSAAYSATARQSGELTGWNSGDGLYLNYFFTLVWVGDTIWSWTNSLSHLRRAHWIGRIVKGFFFFMIFNGAVAFARGPMRWYGLFLCVILVLCWLRAWKCAADRTAEPKLA
jgi:hypothetical protein